MTHVKTYLFPALLFFLLQPPAGKAQAVLTLRGALSIAAGNYQLLQAKENYANASRSAIETAQREGLPDVTLSAQQAYGSLNGVNGLSSGISGITTITSGPVLPTQNWNGSFGALYVSNLNWNIYSFGLQHAKVAAAKGQYERDKSDLEQEQFQQQVRVATAYLNLLSAQRMRIAMEKNLQRAMDLSYSIHSRTDNGLNAGVDSSIANAEVSRARLSLTDAINNEQAQASQLAVQMGITPQPFVLDTGFIAHIPANLLTRAGDTLAQQPILQFLQKRIDLNNLQTAYLSKSRFPRVELFGVLQDRGTGFGSSYGASNPNDYSKNYFSGVSPVRANYLVGIGVTWNFTELGRVKSRVRSQQYIGNALGNEYELEKNNLRNQLAFSNQQIVNAIKKYNEVPFQMQAASDAYLQKKALYENGLATIIDVAQTLYTLNRAEIDRDIACNAVWQAVLFKAAATGNLSDFLNQLPN